MNNRSKEIPETVPRDEFNRVLENLIKTDQTRRKDARVGKKKTEGTIIPPKRNSGQQ